MKVRYFGKIAETVGLQEEKWNVDQLTVANFRQALLEKYPLLSKETIQIAVNLKIESPVFLLNVDDEVAILPPYAGG